MKNLKFRKRELTLKIVVLIKDTGCANYDAYYKVCRRKGEFDANVHYFIDDDGTIHEARVDDAVAGWRYSDNEISVYILAQSNNQQLSDSQNHSVMSLLLHLTKKYPKAEIEERTE